MDCKQSKIDTLLQTSAVYLQQQSLIPDEIFLLQISKINSSKQNFDRSKLSATQDNKAIDVNNAPLDNDNKRIN